MNIKHLKIEKQEYDFVKSEDKLENLSKINIFIGTNNSGKSRFMRFLFYMGNNDKLNFIPDDEKYNYFIKQTTKFKEFINENRNKSFRQAQADALNIINKHIKDSPKYLTESKPHYTELINIYKNIERQPPSRNTYLYFCKEIFTEYFNEINFDTNTFNYNFHKIYIPSLRGLVPVIPKEYSLENTQTDIYAERTKQDYFKSKSKILTDITDFLNEESSEPKNAIITGMQFYDYVKNYLLGDLNQREMIRDYENYLSETFFDKKDVVLIPKVNDDVLTVKIGEEEYEIYNLGDGIQSIISITLPLFLYLKKSQEENTAVLVFIEEPEVGLHPKLQRKLINTLLDERFENFQFFFTTHSNHFIDQSMIDENVSVYLFDKINFNNENTSPKFNIKHVDSEYLEVIKKLGVMPSSALMSNCIILVEGVTDLNHFQTYLNMYQEEIFEKELKYESGIHYTFLIAGGDEYKNTIKNLNETQKEKLLFISDYDNENKDNKKHEFFEENSFNNFHILDVTEVENLVSKSIILKTLENIPKRDKIDINRNFTQIDYTQSDNFYAFIVNTIFNGEKPESLGKEKKLKKRICRTEKEFTQLYDELTPEAKDVAKIIYEFIKLNN
ncbi:AAA family ATPase [uncultured Methanobrevibacter sp.]|uniref:AAA family ATPase n=1 Tax=uncultured Methanobrevibacter sp. TaxID=253161 RepID=UPI0025E40851|nr:AAA family ATPase [uncultured Methanobrevibacter sp.]